jgi:hypothetical protein
METFFVLLVLKTPLGVTQERMEIPDYPTYFHCVNAGKAEASYRRNRTTNAEFVCLRKDSKSNTIASQANAGP